MANTAKVLFRGAATTNTATTLYTVPSNTTTIVTEIAVANNSGSTATFTISLNNVLYAPTVTVGAYDNTTIPVKQVISAGQTITGGASATTVLFHICGVELT